MKKVLPAILLSLPLLASAQGIEGQITRLGYIVDTLIILAAAIALLAFLWGLAKFIFRLGGKEDAVEEGKRVMIWGLVGLFVMISVWGLVNFFQRELIPGADFSDPNIPTFGGYGNN